MTLTTSLREQITGPVVVPGDPDYEDASARLQRLARNRASRTEEISAGSCRT
jgi:hypothetical protein